MHIGSDIRIDALSTRLRQGMFYPEYLTTHPVLSLECLDGLSQNIHFTLRKFTWTLSKTSGVTVTAASPSSSASS